MAERSKAVDSSSTIRKYAWVQIPQLPSFSFFLIIFLTSFYLHIQAGIHFIRTKQQASKYLFHLWFHNLINLTFFAFLCPESFFHIWHRFLMNIHIRINNYRNTYPFCKRIENNNWPSFVFERNRSYTALSSDCPY